MGIMKFEAEVISKHIIKPASPTPDHLRHYQFSFLDQISPPVYNPLLLFYEFNAKTQPNITEISNHLKTSLAKVLSLYYPLAGRFKDNQHVDCNDNGVPYLEAQVNCKLSDVLNNPIPGELNKLMPFELDDVASKYPLGVQLNVFQCGGFAIAQCLTHKLADGLSYFTFSKTWAATAGGEPKIAQPQFISATLFPPKNLSGYDARTGITRNKVTKRFVFSAINIEELRKVQANKASAHPSRVEALSSFILSRFVEATKDIGSAEKFYRVVHAVNLRPRFEPPLPHHSFGNLYRVAMTAPLQISSGEPYHGIREEISKIDNAYVRKLQKGDEHLSSIKTYAKSFAKGEQVTISFSSYCRFPLYDNDFGWGRPTWVGSPALTFKNLVNFMDTREGGGIEAYISLEEEVMTKFESDVELLAYMSSSAVLNQAT
ncbi:PREDICTED: vinorine synthase-like [Fragaria vesca subsp. vesca]|uniref:vinorine synthase-like n=1 Tax=Fragaria vesca subsp. vesca TaxID=101020 RepID=UPI0002C35CCB|nr:PREDICTED: vinorine synthase-like [Fragaria vesca subsp. vesca]